MILLVTAALRTALKNRYVQAVLGGLKPCIIGIILATGIYMILENIALAGIAAAYDWKASILTAILALIMFGPKYAVKKEVSPILLIIISALCGIIVY